MLQLNHTKRNLEVEIEELKKTYQQNQTKLEEIKDKKRQIQEINNQTRLFKSKCQILETKKASMSEKLPEQLKQNLEEKNKSYFSFVEQKLNKILESIVEVEGNFYLYFYFK